MTLFMMSCGNGGSGGTTDLNVNSDVIIESNRNLTDAQVDRHFTPPVASRNYAYPNIAGYASIQPFFKGYKPVEGQLNGLDELPKPDTSKKYDLTLVWLTSFNEVAWNLVYQDTIVRHFLEVETEKHSQGVDQEVVSRSVDYGKEVATAILKWAAKDGYPETRNMPQFAPAINDGYWKPTSPDYMPAIEPYWNYLRPFVMDSASQFTPLRPTDFDTSKGSQFMTEVVAVMDAVDTSTEEHTNIAKFWDCNPNISHHHGHMMYFLQKISPGGHWIHIGLQVLDSKDLNIIEGSETMAVLSISIADAFIACWDEKYRSNYIRPETVIKKKIDPDWQPILQTPAFPEYPSGHSVASSAAATALTALHGSNFAFLDSTEATYGLPTRTYKSFREASNEAAISRLYGGIHYMPAIREGITMGNNVGDLVTTRVKLKEQ